MIFVNFCQVNLLKFKGKIIFYLFLILIFFHLFLSSRISIFCFPNKCFNCVIYCFIYSTCNTGLQVTHRDEISLLVFLFIQSFIRLSVHFQFFSVFIFNCSSIWIFYTITVKLLSWIWWLFRTVIEHHMLALIIKIYSLKEEINILDMTIWFFFFWENSEI